MARAYRVTGGLGGEVPGALGPAELDPRSDWVPVGLEGGLLPALAPRLGSEVDAGRVVHALLAPLRGALEGRPLEALAAALPLPIARPLREGLPGWDPGEGTPAGLHDYLARAGRLLQQPPARAHAHARALFAAARDALAPADAAAVAERLPPELATLWVTSR